MSFEPSNCSHARCPVPPEFPKSPMQTAESAVELAEPPAILADPFRRKAPLAEKAIANEFASGFGR